MGTFIRRQGHRFLLGGAGAAWIIFAAAWFRSPDAAGSDRAVRAIRARFLGAHPEFAAPAAAVSPASHRAGWAVSAGERTGTAWASSLLPVPTGIPLAAPPAPTAPLRPTVRVRASARGPYTVDLEWSSSLPDAPFVLERREAGTEPWFHLPAQGKRHTDETAVPGRTHEYRIRLPGEGIADTARVEVPSIWSFSFQSPTEGAVSVTITKQDRTHGLVRSSRLYRAGERLGWWMDPGAAHPVGTHWISLNGRPVQVNFDCGVTLVSVLPAQVESNHRRCRAKATPAGVFCEEETRAVKTTASAIRLASEGREWTVFHPAPEDRDYRCPAHRGR